MNERALWERDVASKLRIDRSKYRELLNQVWEEGPFSGAEDYEGCVEGALRWYRLGKQAGVSEDTEDTDGEHGEDDKDSRGKENNRSDIDYEVHFDDSTGLRAAALSEYLAKIAATDRRVMSLRKRICGGVRRTFSSEEEALEFLEAHSAESHTNQGWKGIVGDREILRWPDGSPYGRDFIVSEGSLLEELKNAAAYFEKRYPWSENQAAHFILCGGVPQSATIMGGYKTSTNAGVPAHKFDRMTIKLEVEHWMPAESVREAYCKIREKALNDKEVLAQVSLRCASFRNMEVFRFVVGQAQFDTKDAGRLLARLKLPPWPQIKEAWNKQCPESDPGHYKEAKYFKRDFKRAQQAILGTDQGLPGIPGQPMSRDEVKEMNRRMREGNKRMLEKVCERQREQD